jgi:hypothetical protein
MLALFPSFHWHHGMGKAQNWPLARSRAAGGEIAPKAYMYVSIHAPARGATVQYYLPIF